MGKTKGQKAIVALRRVRKDSKLKNGRNGRSNGFARRNATNVLAQSALAAPKRNFGTNKMGGRKSLPKLMKCLDARIPQTLGLPRAVGPYTVIRTTKLHRSNEKFVMFCPFRYNDSASSTIANNSWYDWCGIESVTSSSDVTAANNTRTINMPMLGLGDACEVVPASMTVQVMNPSSLQNANGVFAMTRVNQQLMLGTSPAGLTYDEIAARIVSFYSPRLLTGGKLALRGVKSSAYPLDMSEYSNFAPVLQYSGELTWTGAACPSALSPIVVINETAADSTELEYMITIEWRVRFDPGNPATASHTHHDILQDDLWNEVVRAASTATHAVEELSEDTANEGRAIASGVWNAL